MKVTSQSGEKENNLPMWDVDTVARVNKVEETNKTINYSNRIKKCLTQKIIPTLKNRLTCTVSLTECKVKFRTMFRN